MATKIIHKKSSVAASVPTAGDIAPGELALNLADQKIYSKQTDGTIIEMAPNPNLDNGDIFIGNSSNQTTTASLTTEVQNIGDSRYVNVTGDTMTGDLTLAKGTTSKLSRHALYIGGSNLDSSDASIYIGNDGNGAGYGWELFYVGSGNGNDNEFRLRSENLGSSVDTLRVKQDGTAYFANLAYVSANQRVFADNYHPNADKWTTARTLSLSGDASGSVSWDGSANATLSVTVANDSHSHSISTITDEHRLFNNMGDAHGTRTDFNANYNFGWRYIQGTTNGPGNPSASQYYTVYAGLGNEYPATGAGSYGMQVAYPRNVADPYINIRYKENNSWGSWRKAAAGKADAWTTARTLTLTGDVTGSVIWDGSGNASITTDWRGGTANAVVNMNNFNITNVNHLTFNDPGPTEGIEWLGGSGWRIVECPDDLTTNSGGNLQFVQGSTREMTLNTSGSLYTAAQGTLWGSSNDGSGSGLDADLLDGVQGSSYLRSDATDTFTNLSGTSLTLGSGVTLQESTERVDLLQITSSTSGWAGLQIRNSSNEGRWSFMTDGSSAGFYDDENNDWAVLMAENGGVTLYHNGVANFTTGASYMEMARHLDMNNYDIYGVDQIYHHGDTNTYMQFHNPDEWRVVTGGAERLEVNNSQITSTEPIYAPSFHGDGSGLTNLPSGSAAFNDLTSKTSGTGDYRTTGRFLGEYALSMETTGVQNTAYGYQAGWRVNVGSNNAFFGRWAGRSNTAGKENVAVGSLAMSSQYNSSYGNTAVGYSALMNYGSNSTTNWSRNTAVGWKALTKVSPNTTSFATAVGAEAMENYIGGDNSTGVGKGALRGHATNATGDKNTAVGSHSMYNIQGGFENVGVGVWTLSNCAGGDKNVAIGYNAILDLTSGNLNTAVGHGALENATTGSKNVGIGPSALKNVTTGSSNIGIGGWGATASAYNPAYNITTENNYGYFGHAQITNLYAQVSWTVTSDPRDKEILGPVPIGMDFLRKIEPIAYKMKATREDTKGVDRTRYGFNAAEVLEAEGDDPVIIDKSDENQLRLTDGMIATVVVALKELDKKLNLLDEKLALLESKQ